jgi:DNA polymerase-3 subunit delta'
MIIWMVDKLYVSAAPKILKILEEPPEKTLFILITDEPDQIIKTILSRTLMVRISKSDGLSTKAREDESHFFITFRQWMRDCYSGKIINLVPFSAEIAKAGREKQKSFLQYALKTIGLCSTMNFLGNIGEQVEGEELTFIRNFAPHITAAHLDRFNTLLNDAIFHIERNAHPATLFLDLSLKFVQIFKPEVIRQAR